LRRCAALRADCVEHHSLAASAASIPLARSPALRAARRFVFESLLRIELLFARREGEFRTAVTAGECPVLKSHVCPQLSRFGNVENPRQSSLAQRFLKNLARSLSKSNQAWRSRPGLRRNRTNMNAQKLALGCLAFALCASARQVFAAAPPVGAPAPAFSLLSTAGTHWSLANMRGHVVVVNFFATWCPPCRAETPDLVAVERRYVGKGVIFVGIDDREDASLVSVFAKSKGIHYPLVLDSLGSVSRLYDVRAIPTTYVLDRSGKIRYAQVDELTGDVLSGALDAVLANKPLPQSTLSQKFHDIARQAQSALQADVRSAKAANPPQLQALNSAVTTGVAANKKLDAIQSQPDSVSIGYLDAAQTRDALNGALADAYLLRAGLHSAANATSDRVEAALLLGSIASDHEHFADALAQYETAMTLAPKDTRGYDGAYLAAYEEKQYVKAAQIADAEAQIAPTDPESWLTVASSQNQLRTYGKALDAERTALTLAATAYAKDPTSTDAAYELGRVWLKTARTELLAGNANAARPFLEQAQAAAPTTIVAQQASEQYVALEQSQIAIDQTAQASARGADAAPAKVYVIVRNGSAQARTVNLAATGLPPKWLVSFCYSTVCNPYKVSFSLPARGSKRIELLVAPLGATGGPWTMSVSASGGATAHVRVDANTAKAAITISAS
jgi:cytochrome c biogenesis protein CcmG, thiol:disulfide interchange protein DsbE